MSYVGVILISITLFLAAGFLLIFAITGDVKSIEHLYKKSYLQKPLTAVEESVFLDLKLLAKNNPEQLLNEEQLKKIEHRDIKIVVRKDNNIEYASPTLDKLGLVPSLPNVRRNEHQYARHNQNERLFFHICEV